VSYATIYIRVSTSHKSHNTCIVLGFAIIMFAVDCMLRMQAVFRCGYRWLHVAAPSTKQICN